MKIAVVQMNAIFANVKANLIKAEKYIIQAKSEKAEMILFPEFFTSAIGFSEKMLHVAIDNKNVKSIISSWADKYKIIIGGSFIEFDGNNSFNTFILTFPNGESFEHKKDIPTQFENCYYTSGDGNNILQTPIGNIGVALCWELIRYDTLKRMVGEVDIVLSGSCWWDLPKDADLSKEPLRKYNQSLALDTPVTFAKLIGVPVIHANHCGEVTAFNFPNADKTQTRQLVGATQIINEKGEVCVRRHFVEGEGLIISDVLWSKSKRNKKDNFQTRFWIPDLPHEYIHAWETINKKGEDYYNKIALPYYKEHYFNI